MDCNCPAPTALTGIDNEQCGVDLKQIQRIAIQRLGFGFDPNNLTEPNDINELADWQEFQTAEDDSKIVITPLVSADPIIEAGEAITTGGGDNSTLNGVEENEGRNPSNFSCVFKSLSATVETQIKALECERSLRVFFILQGGRIAYANIADVAKGFESQSFFLSDRNNAGFGTKDTFNFRFALKEGWSENLTIVKPNFNPLTEL